MNDFVGLLKLAPIVQWNFSNTETLSIPKNLCEVSLNNSGAIALCTLMCTLGQTTYCKFQMIFIVYLSLVKWE